MKLTNRSLLGLMAVMVLPLYSGNAEDAPIPALCRCNDQRLRQAPPAPTPGKIQIKPSHEVEEVLKLRKAGLSEDVMLAYVKSSRFFFNLRADDIPLLETRKVFRPR